MTLISFMLSVINHAGKALYLQAESAEDMTGWVYALNNVSKITVSRNLD